MVKIIQKNLWGLISIVIPSKNVNGFSDFFKKSCFEKIAKIFRIIKIMIIERNKNSNSNSSNNSNMQ